MLRFTLLAVPAGDGYRARWLGGDVEPDELLPVLRDIVAQTHDPASLAAVLTSQDWRRLGADAQPRAHEQAVPGVGIIADNAPEAVASRIDVGWYDLLAMFDDEYIDIAWMYLLHPATGRVTVYAGMVSGAWMQHSIHVLGDTPTAGAMRHPAGPLREWVTPQGLVAVHPELDGYPLHLIHLAMVALAPGRAAVIDNIDRVSTVWLVGTGHALKVEASIDRVAGTALLPRPLGGSWSIDTPAVVLDAATVAGMCAALQDRANDTLHLQQAPALDDGR